MLRVSKKRWKCWFCSQMFGHGFYFSGACGHKHCTDCWRKVTSR